ncbi:putative type III restriction endonuclease, res subunit [Rhodococcus sp. MTM3W5.2]|nr:putative type III restriction endonuclease, res subunit [Rhodococcus sp. MTM3W5.2]
MLTAANTRLQQLRAGGMPDAGGLVIATDQTVARAYAKILEAGTGRAPTVVLSDDPTASKKIAEFSESSEPWMVAVRMVSEGVDVPRLAVGVYATSSSTPLFFAQAIGRFVRMRAKGETASVFVPSVPVLLDLASQLELQRDHVLGKPHREKDGLDDELLVDANKQKDEPGEEEKAFTSLGADAELDQVIYDGSSFGTATFAGSDEEADYLGLPGLLDADQMRALLRERQADQLDKGSREPAPVQAPAAVADRVSSASKLAELRKELNGLVAMQHHRTGKPHGWIHGELRRVCGGPPTAIATVEQLTERIAMLRQW